MILTEWIQYYINQGVEHFYLIDNGSTDDYESKNIEYEGKITLVKDDTRYKSLTQNILATKYFLEKVKKSSTWVMYLDCDEYIYIPEFENIQCFLEDFDKREEYLKITDIFVPWKIFGSSNLEKQPRSIIQSFDKRLSCESFINRSKTNYYGHGKTITRTEHLTELCIHKCNFVVPRQTLNPDYSINNVEHFFKNNLYKNNFIFCNHYMVMSKEYYFEVKSKRTGGHGATRNIHYFKQNDNNDIEDRMLIEYLESKTVEEN